MADVRTQVHTSGNVREEKMAFIIVMTGSQVGEYHALGEGITMIGRLEALDIQILDVRISRRHMQICFDADKQEYYALDAGSRGGVFINGTRINDRAALIDGDCITIGMTDLLFTLQDITDRKSALERMRIGKQSFVTLEVPVDTPQKSGAPATGTTASRLRRLRQWAGSPKITLAIVFTDIVDSTALTHNLGNERMDNLRRAHFTRARNLIQKHNGFGIKTNGDEFMVAFHTAVNALDLHDDTGDELIDIRAGMHIGPMTIEEEDVQGAAVSYAARVVGMAAAGGVWLSSEVKNHIDQEKAQYHENISWQDHPDCTLKGFPDRHVLWSVKRNE